MAMEGPGQHERYGSERAQAEQRGLEFSRNIPDCARDHSPAMSENQTLIHCPSTWSLMGVHPNTTTKKRKASSRAGLPFRMTGLELEPQGNLHLAHVGCGGGVKAKTRVHRICR